MIRWWSHKLYIYSKTIDIPFDYNCEYLNIYPLNVAISTGLHTFYVKIVKNINTGSGLE